MADPALPAQPYALRLALPLVLTDAIWMNLAILPSMPTIMARVGAMGVPLVLTALYYDHGHKEPLLSGTSAVTAFLIVFPAAASLTSYLLITVAGPRIDGPHILLATH